MVIVTCDYPLPDPTLQEERFRTHDLGYGNAHYHITAEGRLVWLKEDPGQIRAAPDDAVPAPVGEDLDFHGSFRFGTYVANERVDFCAQFVRGAVQAVTRICRRVDDDYDLDTWPGLADAAESIERRRLINHRRLLRTLEELEPEFAKRALHVWLNRTDLAYWLATPHPELEDITPYRALAQGRHKDVLDLLSRLFYGIPG